MNTRNLATLALLVAAGTHPLPAQAPEPDIFVVRLDRSNGHLNVVGARNVTQRPGYDNQPSFTGDGAGIFYTSVREDAQADIYAVSVDGGSPRRITRTAPESEYSATLMPGLNAVSVIRVERDSTQRLWRIPLDGAADQVILERIKPVGYHTWVNATTLALFVLGNPNTLQLAHTETGTADTITTSIGRSLHTRDGQVSFVHKVSRDEWWLTMLDPATKATRRVVQMPPRVEDYDWTPQGEVLIGEGSVLKLFNPRTGTGWETVADLSEFGITGITRLAVSPRGDVVAVVAVPAAK